MEENICFDAALLGTKRHLLVFNDQCAWVDDVPTDAWHFSGHEKIDSDHCFDTLLALNHVTIDVLPPEKFVNAMATLTNETQIPWAYVLPTDDHRAFMKRLVTEAKVILPTLTKTYYENTWTHQCRLLTTLQPAKIDVCRFDEVRSLNPMNSKVIDSFAPKHGDFAERVTYNRFASRTGRLTVATGPNILTIKREYRDVLRSSFDGGKILYVDFAALEPHVLLYEANGRCDAPDMYMYIADTMFKGTASRDAIKVAVISEMYGSGKRQLEERLGIQGDELDEFVHNVQFLFKTDVLKKRVKAEFYTRGFITNRHGRRIEIDTPLDHIFVNSYIQSTGVDVSLLGFIEVMRRLESPGVRPLFILHDALIIDVARDQLNEALAIKSVKVPGYVQKFPVKCKPFTTGDNVGP